MKVINLFGGPCTGKSTVAAGLFERMKLDHLRVELVTEFAKGLTWEGHLNILEGDQLYVFANQHRRILRLLEAGTVDYVVTDSPFILGLLYLTTRNIYDQHKFKELVVDTFNKYDNINFLLERGPQVPYQQEGRYQDENGALVLQEELEHRMQIWGVRYTKCVSGPKLADSLFETLKVRGDITFRP